MTPDRWYTKAVDGKQYCVRTTGPSARLRSNYRAQLRRRGWRPAKPIDISKSAIQLSMLEALEIGIVEASQKAKRDADARVPPRNVACAGCSMIFDSRLVVRRKDFPGEYCSGPCSDRARAKSWSHLPAEFFRVLHEDEVQSFKDKARTIWQNDPDGYVSQFWHPVVRVEIARLCREGK